MGSKDVTGTSTALNRGTTTNTYDANGFLVGVDDLTKDSNDRTIINDAAGRVLCKRPAIPC